MRFWCCVSIFPIHIINRHFKLNHSCTHMGSFSLLYVFKRWNVCVSYLPAQNSTALRWTLVLLKRRFLLWTSSDCLEKEKCFQAALQVATVSLCSHVSRRAVGKKSGDLNRSTNVPRPWRTVLCLSLGHVGSAGAPPHLRLTLPWPHVNTWCCFYTWYTHTHMHTCRTLPPRLHDIRLHAFNNVSIQFCTVISGHTNRQVGCDGICRGLQKKQATSDLQPSQLQVWGS